MKAFFKALCLTLLFFAYSLLLFGGGIVFQRQFLSQNEEPAGQSETQSDINIAAHKTAEEYHKYYEIVVSRIKTTEFEGFNKKAFDDYILAHDERLNALVEVFYPDREDTTKYGSSFPMVYANFKKAYEEAELFTYKSLMLAMSTMDIEEEIERIFKDNQTYSVQQSVNMQNEENPLTTEPPAAEESLEESEAAAQNMQTKKVQDNVEYSTGN